MSEQNDTRKLFELYDLMEEKLEELEMNFDEFTILYKAFRNQSPTEAPKPKKSSNPFPWAQAAGTGWS